MTHEEATRALMNGCHVAREGWKIGNSLVLSGPYKFAMALDRNSMLVAIPGTPSIMATFFIDMEHPDGTLTYWTGTTDDLLAKDWMIVPPGDLDHPSISARTLFVLRTVQRTRNQTPKKAKKEARKKVKKKIKEKNKKTHEAQKTPETQETMPF